MSTGDAKMDEILKLQDVQLVNAITQLNKNPAELDKYIKTRKSDIFDRVTQEHSDTFEKVYGDMIRANDTSNNTMYYYIRNKDLDALQSAVMKRAKGEAEAAQFDNQTSTRQYEVNEWTVGNKQDTLFVLQLSFLTFAFLTPLFYGVRMGIITYSVFIGIASLLGVALLLTAIVRWQYTSKTRDNRFWNRRRFASMGGPPTELSCDSAVAAYKKAQETVGEWDKQLDKTLQATGAAFQASSAAFGNTYNQAMA